MFMVHFCNIIITAIIIENKKIDLNLIIANTDTFFCFLHYHIHNDEALI